MEFSSFIENFAYQFEDKNISILKEDTEFKKLPKIYKGNF